MAFGQTLEMSISREEFLRHLRLAFGPCEADGDMIRCSYNDRRVTIRLFPLPPRQLGPVVVARHLVEIAFDAPPGAETRTFMERFHRAFMRGGG
jgi:hypothetical protein